MAWSAAWLLSALSDWIWLVVPVGEVGGGLLRRPMACHPVDPYTDGMIQERG